MAKRWRIRSNKTLIENAGAVVPAMAGDFLSCKVRVAGHPRLKNELHKMRVLGKRLRYAMEMFEPAFGESFSVCLEELKVLLESMGRIHDCDMNIRRLKLFLEEIRCLNRKRSTPVDRVVTSPLTRLVREQMALRQRLFTEVVAELNRWEQDGFPARLKDSMLKSQG